jgi:hypothetical protein
LDDSKSYCCDEKLFIFWENAGDIMEGERRTTDAHCVAPDRNTEAKLFDYIQFEFWDGEGHELQERLLTDVIFIRELTSAKTRPDNSPKEKNQGITRFEKGTE